MTHPNLASPRIATLFVVFLALIASPQFANALQQDSLDALKTWLASPERSALDQQPWATRPITRQQAEQASELLWDAHTKQLKEQRKAEWDNKVIDLDGRKMKFEFKTFGDADKNGRSLYISMHGGGSAPAKVNEQQWQNQIRLYQPEEGVYLAPRAPTDTWNLWHESHIDLFFERIIQDAILFENVDPNRVYLMGYSAGGDGVYQLAPRMADRLAAAAMMAGHPNDASPLGLRNIGFTLHMGGNDSAYKRNAVAAEWKKKLAALRKQDPKGYDHSVKIHKGKGHWMDREDAVAVPWMAKFRRDPLPKRIVWKQSSVTHGQFYWLATNKAVSKSLVVASREGNTIQIEKIDGVCDLTLMLNDDMMDLDKAIDLKLADKPAVELKAQRSIATLVKTLQQRGDRQLMFSCELEVQGLE